MSVNKLQITEINTYNSWKISADRSYEIRIFSYSNLVFPLGALRLLNILFFKLFNCPPLVLRGGELRKCHFVYFLVDIFLPVY